LFNTIFTPSFVVFLSGLALLPACRAVAGLVFQATGLWNAHIMVFQTCASTLPYRYLLAVIVINGEPNFVAGIFPMGREAALKSARTVRLIAISGELRSRSGGATFLNPRHREFQLWVIR
jgi:hypothetical protein